MKIWKYVGNYLVLYTFNIHLFSLSIKRTIQFLMCSSTFDTPCQYWRLLMMIVFSCRLYLYITIFKHLLQTLTYHTYLLGFLDKIPPVSSNFERSVCIFYAILMKTDKCETRLQLYSSFENHDIELIRQRLRSIYLYKKQFTQNL